MRVAREKRHVTNLAPTTFTDALAAVSARKESKSLPAPDTKRPVRDAFVAPWAAEVAAAMYVVRAALDGEPRAVVPKWTVLSIVEAVLDMLDAVRSGRWRPSQEVREEIVRVLSPEGDLYQGLKASLDGAVGGELSPAAVAAERRAAARVLRNARASGDSRTAVPLWAVAALANAKGAD